MISTIEDAYRLIGTAIAKHATSDNWEELMVQAPILSKGLGGTVSVERSSNRQDRDIPIGFSLFQIQRAALYLRDDLLKTTGQRIWGLTFTLYPTGKFKIEYDYNKPEGYEETDEAISFDDALDNLQNILTGNKPKE